MRDFVAGFQEGAAFGERWAAQAGWGWWSRDLSDSERELVERRGYGHGRCEGVLFALAHPPKEE